MERQGAGYIPITAGSSSTVLSNAKRTRDKKASRKRRHAKDGRTSNKCKKGKSNATETTLPNSLNELEGLSQPGRGTLERLHESPEQVETRLTRLQEAVSTILECIGEDLNREGLLNTPTRYAKAILFLTKGYQQNLNEIVNNAIFHEHHNEMVIVKDIELFSMCEHHMLPFSGKMHIGYVPNGNVIGLSKLPRIAEMFSRRLQVQERLTNQVANAILEVLKPQGVAVVMESSHLCMVMRGVEKAAATTITSSVLGCFEQKRMRDEFFGLVGINKMSA